MEWKLALCLVVGLGALARVEPGGSWMAAWRGEPGSVGNEWRTGEAPSFSFWRILWPACVHLCPRLGLRGPAHPRLTAPPWSSVHVAGLRADAAAGAARAGDARAGLLIARLLAVGHGTSI